MSMIYTSDHKLSDDIIRLCPELFSQGTATIIEESPYPQPFGNAWVIVKINAVLFRFVWDRATPIVQVKFAEQGSWEWLDAVVARVTGPPDTSPADWSDWCALIKQLLAPGQTAASSS